LSHYAMASFPAESAGNLSDAHTSADSILPSLLSEPSPSGVRFNWLLPPFDGEPPPIQIRRRVISGLAVMAFFAVLSLLAFGRYEPVTLKAPPWLRLLGPILIAIALVVVRSVRLGRRWRWWAMAFCIALTLGYTANALVVDEDDPLVCMLYALTMVSTLSLPWEARWETVLGLTNMVAFTVAALTGVVESSDDGSSWRYSADSP
jgi:hypothetical protein